MREQVISAVRHLAGALAAAVVGWLSAQAFMDGVDAAPIGEGVEALVMGIGFATYALVEKALKPVARRYLGSSGE